MVFMDMTLPIIMIGFGKYFSKYAPGKINRAFGYRTNMSMKNNDTWVFAHNYVGKIWFSSGRILLILSVLAMIPFAGKATNTVALVALIITAVQIIIMIATIFITEKALKTRFDKDGNLRETVTLEEKM